MVDSSTVILSTVTLYSATKGTLVASAVYMDLLTQSSDYNLVLMLDPQANHSFVYYAASVDFVGDYLQRLHSNDDSIMIVTVLANNTEVRIAPSRNVNINGSFVYKGEEIIFKMDIGETLTVSSNEDLTGSRITSNKAVSLNSGHYCAPNKTVNCSILNEQLPPYNGETPTLYTLILMV